ncbi:GL17772 [Drosophila persimilis]|uniref:GL17772 n=1 Tax=Drosophila persimilis TaxID=7234 RepID=B4GIX7_DROPE|nr:glutathione S-transferase 1 [Drosophila persimilis]EDW36395.1 GL17772 [Drosophila persimilis]
MGKLILYGMDASAPVRSVILTLNALGLPFEYKVVNLLAKEQLKPEFLKMNPLHTVPTLDDDGFYVYDSHAINAYLVAKYGKDGKESLYPKDLQQRAIVDQRMHYDSSVVGRTLRAITFPLFRLNETQIPKARIDALADVYTTLETFLNNNEYIAGKHLTIADFHIIAILSTIEIFLAVDAGKYPKVSAWMQRITELPYYAESNGNRLVQCATFFKSKNFTIV